MPRFITATARAGGQTVATTSTRTTASSGPTAPVSRRGDRWEAEANRAAETVARRPAQSPAPVRAPGRPRVVVRSVSVEGSSGGQPIAPGLRQRLEPALGADLSAVRIHTGPDAAQAAARVGARAFVQHNHIFLAAGQSPNDLTVIAHEAAHTVQQSAEQNAEYAHGPPATSTATLSPATPGMIQPYFGESLVDAVGDAAGAVYDAGADAVAWAGDKLADAFWWAVKKFLPGWLADALGKIRELGIVGFLKDLITAPFRFIFSGLREAGEFVGNFIGQFGKLGARVAKILGALAKGNCKPLLEGVRELKATVAEISGAVWDRLVEFFRPVGDFFTGVWNNLLKPIGGFLKEVAGDVWDFITGLGSKLWQLTAPVRDAVSGAWDFITDLLGIGGGGGSSEGGGGLLDWITAKASEAWDGIKSFFKPVTEPLSRVFTAIGNFLPIRLIGDFIRSITNWAEHAGEMADNMDNGSVAENQKPLRAQILPGILNAIAAVRRGVSSAGDAIAGTVTSITGGVAELISGIANTPPFDLASGALNWLGRAANQLGGWIAGGVHGVFGGVDGCLATLARWVNPILRALEKIFDVMSDLVGRMGELIKGVWHLIPACIREPLQDFLIHQILGRIPVFKEILEVPNIVARVLGLARKIVIQVFVHGDLLGAAWTFFSSVLEFFGLPPDLVVSLVRNAAKAFKDIIRNPIGFIINTIKAATKGLGQFIDHIWTHLLKGLADWLFGQLKDVNITVPREFSIAGVFDVVSQILGLTKEHVLGLIAKKKGDAVAQKVRRALDAGAFVLRWLKVLIEKGPVGFWEEIRNHLNDLWDTVIEKVKGYVMEKIIQKATQWLLGFLDISGITPAINTIIAVYNAIESFMQYLKQILEIVNSVFLGVSDIAKGAIARAADFVEGAAVRVLPIAIGFLANQLGLGKLGEKIKEVVTAIRTKVDGAIEKLIDAAGTAWESLKETGRQIAGSIFDWWHARESAPAEDGEEHSVYLEGEPENPRLMVASAPMDADLAIQLIEESSLGDAEKKKALGSAKERRQTITVAVKELTKLNRQLGTGATPGNRAADSEAISAQNKLMRAAMRELVEILAKAAFVGGSYDDLEQTVVPDLGSAKASKAKADPLTPKRRMGSPPSVDPPGWAMIVKKRLTDNAPNYVRLHLINENFEGSGAAIGNLVPGSKQNNGDHLRSVENPLKDLVGPHPNDRKYKAQVWYEASVNYYSASQGKGWAADVKVAGVKASDFAESIDFRWGLYNWKGKKDKWKRNAAAVGSFRLGPVPLPDF